LATAPTLNTADLLGEGEPFASPPSTWILGRECDRSMCDVGIAARGSAQFENLVFKSVRIGMAKRADARCDR
jgi:hypothetical protein